MLIKLPGKNFALQAVATSAMTSHAAPVWTQSYDRELLCKNDYVCVCLCSPHVSVCTACPYVACQCVHCMHVCSLSVCPHTHTVFSHCESKRKQSKCATWNRREEKAHQAMDCYVGCRQATTCYLLLPLLSWIAFPLIRGHYLMSSQNIVRWCTLSTLTYQCR